MGQEAAVLLLTKASPAVKKNLRKRAKQKTALALLKPTLFGKIFGGVFKSRIVVLEI
jgi:hypothetical protein